MEDIKDLLAKLTNACEYLGKWKHFLDSIEDWSSPAVTMAQREIKRLSEKRDNLVNELSKEKEEQNEKI